MAGIIKEISEQNASELSPMEQLEHFMTRLVLTMMTKILINFLILIL